MRQGEAGGKARVWAGIAAVLCIVSALADPSPPVQVQLRSPWPAAPLLLEILEAAHEEQTTSFFPLLTHITSNTILGGGSGDDWEAARVRLREASDEAVLVEARQIIKERGLLKERGQKDNLELALALRSQSPKIAAFWQLYESNGLQQRWEQGAAGRECDSWIDFAGEIICSEQELNEAWERSSGSEHQIIPSLVPFDHVYASQAGYTPPSGRSAVLYADPYSPNFQALHKRLCELADTSSRLQYILRWKPLLSSGDGYLAGYGAALDLKKVDYLVIDDRKLADTAAVKGGQGEEGAHSIESDILHKEQAWMATQLKTSKEDEKQSIGSLTENELSDLAVKAAYVVAKSKDPLKALRQLSQDFPRHGVALARSAARPSKSFLNEVKEMHETQVQAGGDDVWLNGKVLTGKEFQPFGLLSILRSERAIVHSLTALNLSTSDAVDLLSSPAINQAFSKEETSAPYFDASDRIERSSQGGEEGPGAIVYWNDLEVEGDPRYARYSPLLSTILRPMYPGSFPTLRRNLFNIIVVMDLAKVESCKFLSESVHMALSRVALRWGFVPSNIEDPVSPSSQLARFYWLVLDKGGVDMAAKYLRRLAFASEGSMEVDVSKAQLEVEKILKMTSDEVEEATKDYSHREVPTRQYIRRLRANEAERGDVFINGQHVAFDSHFFQFLHQTIAMQIQSMAPLIYYGQIEEEADVSHHFYDLPNTFSSRSPLTFPPTETTIKTRGMVLGADILAETVFVEGDGDSLSYNSTVWLVGDLESQQGAKMLSDVKQIMINAKVRVGKAGRILQSQVGVADAEVALVVNGKVVTGFQPEKLTSTDYMALFQMEAKKVDAVVEALSNTTSMSADLATRLASVFSMAFQVDASSEGIFNTPSQARSNMIDHIKVKECTFSIGDKGKASLHFSVLLDPITEMAQSWSSVLQMLSGMEDVYIKVILNPQPHLRELPIKRYYRYSAPHQLTFDGKGRSRREVLSFRDMPLDAVLTMGLDAPPAWLTMASDAIYDLDNIRLKDVVTPSVNAVYDLKYILIEGHARDETTKSVPRGLQLVLETMDGSQQLDTIVMANLAYFQFRAKPGLYRLRLRQGRSTDLFDMESVGNLGFDSPGVEATGNSITLSTLQGLTIYPRLAKKKGKEKEILVEEEGKAAVVPIEEEGSVLSRAKSLLTSVVAQKKQQQDVLQASPFEAKAKEQAVINVFTVASGHLYERMTYIMILSVLKHTKSTVKFWFIENYLSPSFKEFIPHLAQEYHFEYELITYAWPHWLRSQKEKQRSIWGMKVLFLDVIFPLGLSKVIFVDADQIVRADLKELIDTDLKGAPYGFPPMGNDSFDMDNFRFWEQPGGYWQKFLAGKPYPISALFVIDLNTFRLQAAGDKLRGHYQALSQDPNSLSNLDQDLVASMIHVVNIHSLAKEWLWCETWCSWDWYDQAKSIDLCSNPKTKEPKLDRAKRQIPEWTKYDDEVARAAIKFREEGKLGANVVAPNQQVDTASSHTNVAHDEL
ncbi:hypothetical protein CBS101457_003078 [Exobasidium rhododendri]|nr:hypothetical protein CBS101457_003078 [Exobasidium rhododendri]